MRRALILACVLAGCRPPPPKVPGPATTAAAPIDPERVPFSADARAAELASLRDALRDGYSHLETKKQQWGVDLDALFQKYEPLARKAETWSRYELVMVGFVSEFHDAHLAWRRQRAVREKKRRIVRIGVDSRFVDGALYLSSVWPGSGAERAGLKVGDRIVAIDDDTVEEAMKRLARVRSWSRVEDATYDFADEWPASRVDVDTPPKPRKITRQLDDGTREVLSVEPETKAPPGYKKEPLKLEHRDAIALFRLHSLALHVADLERKLDNVAALLFADPNGVVIDLRGNNGGYDNGGRAVAARLTAVPLDGGETRIRLSPRARSEHAEWKELAEDPARAGWSLPQSVHADPLAKKPYPGKIVVLIDAGCRSSCESLTLLLHALGAKLVGEATGGSSGAPITVPLSPSGAKVTIPAWAMFDLQGLPIEGRGVAPDEEIRWTREDLVSGKDPVLARGLELAAAKN
jgi:C-terminal processing protease CtpA/Prc